MFYRFNAHKQGPESGRQSQHKDTALDQTARRMVSAVLKFQRRWAGLMGNWAAKLPGRWMRILAVVSFAVGSYFCLGLIFPRLSYRALSEQELLLFDGPAKARETAATRGSADSLKTPWPQGKPGAGKH